MLIPTPQVLILTHKGLIPTPKVLILTHQMLIPTPKVLILKHKVLIFTSKVIIFTTVEDIACYDGRRPPIVDMLFRLLYLLKLAVFDSVFTITF